MNAKHLIAAALVFSATGAAFAQSADVGGQTYGFLGLNSPAASQNVVSTKSRAAVVAELKSSPAQTESFVGVTQPVGGSDNVISRGKTRAEVVAELKQAEQDGTLQTASFAGFRSPVGNTAQSAAPQSIAAK
jgi:hypothetical protein